MAETELLDKWKKIKSAIDNAEKRILALKTERKYAEDDLNKILSDMGVKTIDEAKALIVKMESERKEAINLIEGLVTKQGIKI